MPSSQIGRWGRRAGPLLLAGLLGLVIGALWMSVSEPISTLPPEPRSSGPDATAKAGGSSQASRDSRAFAARDLSTLQRELRSVRHDNEQLLAEIEDLETELERAEARALDEPTVAAAPMQAASKPRARAHGTQQKPGTRTRVGPHEDADWFDDLALTDIGLSDPEVEEIQTRWQRFEMEKLYLDDAARREGTFGKPQYRRNLEALRDGLRSDLGPEGYDAYLYATAQPNRVIIQNVLPDSPAALAGLESGDVVIDYAGERVFSPGEFKRATIRGDPEDLVLVGVLRNDQLMSFRLSRGPLGIRMKPVREEPYLDR